MLILFSERSSIQIFISICIFQIVFILWLNNELQFALYYVYYMYFLEISNNLEPVYTQSVTSIDIHRKYLFPVYKIDNFPTIHKWVVIYGSSNIYPS